MMGKARIKNRSSGSSDHTAANKRRALEGNSQVRKLVDARGRGEVGTGALV